MGDMKVQYFIGKHSYTKEIPFFNTNFLEKQFSLSIPLITGATLSWKSKKKWKNYKIYVGKEIELNHIAKEKYKLEKYQISIEELADLAVKGYKRACILNFKKYDQVIVGVEENAFVVPDYFALKKIFFQMKYMIESLSKESL